MSDAARRFAARYGLKLEISGAVGAPGAQTTNVKGFQHISPLEPCPNLPNTPGALGAESDPISMADEYCPSRPKPGESLGAGARCEKSAQFGGFQRTRPNCPMRPNPTDDASNAWDLTQTERKAALARLQPRTTPTDALDGLRQAALQHPPSWADATARPSRGCWCSCCKGQRWWCEVNEPKGWRCAQCHPPDHLDGENVRLIQT